MESVLLAGTLIGVFLGAYGTWIVATLIGVARAGRASLEGVTR